AAVALGTTHEGPPTGNTGLGDRARIKKKARRRRTGAFEAVRELVRRQPRSCAPPGRHADVSFCMVMFGPPGPSTDTGDKPVHIIRILRPPSLPALAATRDPSRCAVEVRGRQSNGFRTILLKRTSDPSDWIWSFPRVTPRSVARPTVTPFSRTVIVSPFMVT